MVELKKTENIKKAHGYYVHTTKVTYPDTNVRNMVAAWKEAVEQYEEWLGKYEEYVEEAKKAAIQAVEVESGKIAEELSTIAAMSEKERFEHWQAEFNKRVDEFENLKNKKDELISSLEKQNLELLTKYKQQYTEELSNKKEALKRWTI